MSEDWLAHNISFLNKIPGLVISFTLATQSDRSTHHQHPMKSSLKEKYAGWGQGGEKFEPAEFQGRTNRRDDFTTENSLLESLTSEYSHHGKSKGILYPPRPAPSTAMRPSADRRVRFVSPRQLRIEEESAYHSFELKNLTMALDASNASLHRVGPGYHRGAGRFVQDHPRYCPTEEDSSTLLSHDSFSVEASVDYAKQPKSSSKWTRSASPFRARGRSKSPGRNRSTSKSRSADRKSSHRLPERERGRSPGRGGGRGRDRHYDM